ncbi:MAG: hypothetical protein HYX41_04600 [Bdellovibrio sp.]|nr:hypothetical protein [Bdellovibrio sp.]
MSKIGKTKNMKPSPFQRFFAIFFFLFLPIFSGCSLFFGNIRPVEEKSKDYSIQDLAVDNPNWVLINKTTEGSGAGSESGKSDLAYQSKKSKAIISVSSACRKFPNAEGEASLKDLTRGLLLGMTTTTTPEEKEILVNGAKGLETTVRGKMLNSDVKIRAVVLRVDQCLFDLMYLASPQVFDSDLEVFSKFVRSIRVGP